MIRLSAFSDEAGQGLSSQIEALKRNNLFLTELRSVDGKNVRELSLAEARRIAHTLQRNGIGLSALASPLGKARIDVDLNDYLLEVRRMCELAVVFATDRIRIFSFFDAYDQEERVFEYLNAMVEVAAEYGVSLCHENERNVFGDLSERVLTLWDRVKGLKCIYDFANYLQVGELPHDNMDKLYPITDFFHIKDMVWETGEIVPAGFGDGGISELIQRLDRQFVQCTL